MWIVALDDYLKEREPGYEARRASDPAGSIVLGLRIPRNCAVHDLVSVHAADPTADRSTGVLAAVWKPLEPSRKQNKKSLAAYQEHVCGKSVDQTLRDALDFLWMRADGESTSGGDLPWLE